MERIHEKIPRHMPKGCLLEILYKTNELYKERMKKSLMECWKISQKKSRQESVEKSLEELIEESWEFQKEFLEEKFLKKT